MKTAVVLARRFEMHYYLFLCCFLVNFFLLCYLSMKSWLFCFFAVSSCFRSSPTWLSLFIAESIQPNNNNPKKSSFSFPFHFPTWLGFPNRTTTHREKEAVTKATLQFNFRVVHTLYLQKSLYVVVVEASQNKKMVLVYFSVNTIATKTCNLVGRSFSSSSSSWKGTLLKNNIVMWFSCNSAAALSTTTVLPCHPETRTQQFNIEPFSRKV